MQFAGPATYVTLEGGDYLRFPSASSVAGRFLQDYGPDPADPSNGRLLDWSSGPALIEPAVAPGANTDYLSPTGWRTVPPAVAPGGSAGQLQYNNGTTFAGMSGSVVSGNSLTLGGTLTAGNVTTAGDVTGANLLGTNSIGVNYYLQFGYGLGYGGRFATKTDGLQLQDWAGTNPGFLQASEVRLGGDLVTPNARVRSVTSNLAEIRSGDGLSYGSATAQAFLAQDYVQGHQRILIGSSSGGRLLPITDGVAVYNWAQSGLGNVNTAYTYAQNGFYAGTATNSIRMELSGNGLGLVSTGGISWAPATTYGYIGDVYNVADARILRNATGQLDVRADSGLRIRNLANGADGPFSASTGTFSGNVNTDYVGRSSNVEPSIRFTSSQGQFWAANVNMYYWNNNGWFPTTTGYANLGMLNQAWAALSLERPSWQGNTALVNVRHKSGGDPTHTAITVTDYGLTSYFNVAHNGNITSSGILALTSTTAASNKIQWKDDGAGDWVIASGGVAQTDGFRIVKQGVADIASFRPSQSIIYTPWIVSGGTITASTPALNVSQTWNNAAIAFTAAKFNITDTASLATSLFVDYQLGGTSKAKIDKLGSFTGANATFKHTTSVNPGGIVIRDYQPSNGGYSNLEIAGSNWSAGTGLQFINHSPTVVSTAPFQCTTSFGAVTLYAGVTGSPSTPENGIRITADTTNAYIFTLKYASSPYPPLIVSGTGIKLKTGNGAWSDLAGWGTTALELDTSGNLITLVDKQIGTTEGQQRLYFANNTHTYYGAGPTGNHVFRRNNGAEYAPIIAQTIALGGQTSNPATGCLLAIDDMQGSFYPSIKITKSTWGSPIQMSWATESSGISSTGSGPLFTHIQTITQTSLSNSPVNGAGIDARCEYDQPYVAGLYVRGRKTRTDAPTHPNLAYGIYAVANSGKASGLGGAAGYFLCETANVAGVQIRAAAAQTQPLMLIQDSAATTLFVVDNTGNTTLYGYSGLNIAYGSCYIHQDGNFQIGTHAKLKRATNDLKVCAPNTYFRNFADSADANIYAAAAVFSSTVKATQHWETQSTAPTPGTNESATWTASGSGTKDGIAYDQGDYLITINVGGTSKTKLLADFSAM